MLQAVIFDIDGTLVDSVNLHALAWQEAFREFGHFLPLEGLREQIGKGGDQLMPVFLSRDEIEAVGDKLEARRDEIFKSRFLSQVKPFPGVRELFGRIAQDGIRVALASSAKGGDLAIYKRIAGISDLIDIETSSDDAEKSKPHPDIFEAALRRLKNVTASDAIVVGDTPYDAEAAGKLGIPTIAVLSGGWTETELMHAGAVAVYRDIADLLANYLSSPLGQ